MKIVTSGLLTVGTTLFLLACAPEQKQASNEPAAPRGTVLVKQLPAGVEGLELRNGALRLKSGYNFVKQPRHQFAVVRMSDGQTVTSGGCGCTGGTCDPVLRGGIAVCEGNNCTGTCGLALTIAGVRKAIMNF
jgi:hypothetical protein